MWRFTYGPFLSRRLGWSLGVDLLPIVKTCSMNCIYCEIGETYTTGHKPVNYRIDFDESDVTFLINELDMRIDDYESNKIPIESITIGYNGEPTLITNLDMIIDKIHELLLRKKVKIKLSIFTNSTTLYDNRVKFALSKTDQVIAKLDCAIESMYQKINVPCNNLQTPISIENIIEELKRYKEIYPNNYLIIQTLLFGGKLSYTSKDNLDELINAYNTIQPNRIDLYTISRAPKENYVIPIDINSLEEIKLYIVQNVTSSLRSKIFAYGK